MFSHDSKKHPSVRCELIKRSLKTPISRLRASEVFVKWCQTNVCNSCSLGHRLLSGTIIFQRIIRELKECGGQCWNVRGARSVSIKYWYHTAAMKGEPEVYSKFWPAVASSHALIYNNKLSLKVVFSPSKDNLQVCVDFFQ